MRMGKLTAEELQKIILDKLRRTRAEVVLTAAQGEDCAALKTDGYILISSDPITAQMPPESLGELVVNVCCNDVLSNGGEPIALLLTVIMPPASSTQDVEKIMIAAQKKAEKLNVDIVGGHTEFSDCVTRPIVCGTAVGKCDRLIAKTSMKNGDKLFVTKSLGMEGTTIIADGGEETFTDEEKQLLTEYREQLSVYAEGSILKDCPSVTAMHDITEGGVIGAVAEICLGCGKGADIYENKFPVSNLTRRLCDKYGIDPARLISSGSMLFAASDTIGAQRLRQAGIEVSEIGKVTDGEVLLHCKNGDSKQVKPQPDELYYYLTRCNR